MSSKLLKGPRFGQPARMLITLPHPKEDVLFFITTVVLKSGKIDIVGHINDKGLGERIFQEGLGRLYQYHAQKTLVSAPGIVSDAPSAPEHTA